MTEHWKNLSIETLPEEEWKSVIGFEELYEISSLGRIKSLPKPFFGVGTNGRGMTPLAIVKQNLGTTKGKEYLRVALSKNGKPVHKSVHRLVAEHFIPNPDNKPQVNHIKGIRTDNRASQLEWATNSENVKHAFKIGLAVPNTDNINIRGDKHGRTKISEADVLEIRRLAKTGMQPIKINKLYPQCSHSTICGIIIGKNFKYLKEGIMTKEETKALRYTPVVQISLDGFIVEVYPTQQDAIRTTGITNVRAVLRGKQKTAGGYYWK